MWKADSKKLLLQLITTSLFLLVIWSALTTGSSLQAENCTEPGSKNKTISVLMLGNSLMNGVVPKLDYLLECAGYTSHIAINNPGGKKLFEHDVLEQSNQLIEQGFDIVILQEQSAGIAYWHKQPYPALASLKKKIEQSGGTMMFYQTWGYKPGGGAEQIAGYETVGRYFNVPVCPIGRAWQRFDTNHSGKPPFELFSDDRHASHYGQVLTAYVLFVCLTGESPEGLSALSLEGEEAELLQDIAVQVRQKYHSQANK